MSPAKPNLVLEFALLALLAFLWGSSYLLIKLAVVDIPPVTLIATRVTIAAIFLVAVLLLQGARLPRDSRSWRRLLIQAFLSSIGPWVLIAWAQQYVDSGLAGVLNSTSPIFVFLMTLLFLRHEEVSGWKLAGALLGILGVVLVIGIDALRGLGQDVVAQLAAVLGAVLYAGAAIYGRRFVDLPPGVTVAGAMIWATVWLVPLSLAIDKPWTLSPSGQALLAAVLLAVFSTGVALLIYFRLVRTIGPMGVASQAYLRAGISVLLGVAVLGERLTPAVAAGLLAIILGVAAINRRSR